MTTRIDPRPSARPEGAVPAPDPEPTPLAEPALAPPPPDGALHGFDDVARWAFRMLNRWFMTPVLRAGLGPWVSSPIGGYLVLLRVHGRRTGLTREVPLAYFVAEGSVWLIAGFGPDTAWYRNLLADPRVDLWLPGRRVAGTAVEVRDPVVRARIVPPLVRSTGLPAFLGGVNPWRASDEAILQAMNFVPLIRVYADCGPVEAGADDPGGTGWRWRQAVVSGMTLVAWRMVSRGTRGLRSRRASLRKDRAVPAQSRG